METKWLTRVCPQECGTSRKSAQRLDSENADDLTHRRFFHILTRAESAHDSDRTRAMTADDAGELKGWPMTSIKTTQEGRSDI